MKNHLQFVKTTLLRDGKISRNYCLQHFISRLSARIADLEEEGYRFDTKRIPNGEGWDYEYILIKRPEPKQLSLV